MFRLLRIMAARKTVNDLVQHYETLHMESKKTRHKTLAKEVKAKSFKEKISCIVSWKSANKKELVSNLPLNNTEINDLSESASLSSNKVKCIAANFNTNQTADQDMCIDQSDTCSTIVLSDRLNITHEPTDSLDTIDQSHICTTKSVSKLNHAIKLNDCTENIKPECIWTSTMIWPCCEQSWSNSSSLKLWNESADKLPSHNITSSISTSGETISSLGSISRQSIYSDDDVFSTNVSNEKVTLDPNNASTDGTQLAKRDALPLPPRNRTITTTSDHSDSNYDDQNNPCVKLTEYWPVYANVLDFKTDILASETTNTQNELLYKKQYIYDNKQSRKRTKVSIVTLKDDNESSVLEFDNKKDFITHQLITTEETYISTMEFVINKYLKSLETHIGIPNTKLIFANYEKICNDTKSFLEDLKSTQFDYEKIGLQFIRKKNLFDRYTLFCRNKKRSHEAQKEFNKAIESQRKSLSDPTEFRDHIFQPIRRLTHYKLYLHDLQKQMKKSNLNLVHIEDAIQMLDNTLINCNNIIELDLINGMPFGIAKTGKLLLRDSFKLCRRDIVVFLYQLKIILADIDNKNANNYIFRRSINIDEIALVIQAKPATVLGIECYKSKKYEETLWLYADTVEIKDKWYKVLYDILWEQLLNQKKQIQIKIASSISISTPLEEPCPEFI